MVTLDLIVIKCHDRYWRNQKENKHGLNKYLLGVKLPMKHGEEEPLIKFKKVFSK